MSYIFEICTNGVESLKAAIKAKAQRVELCSCLVEGGITPSFGTLEKCLSLAHNKILVNVLIRARGGDFLYSDDEIDIMSSDIKNAVSLGVNAIVIGALNKDGSIDRRALDKWVKEANGTSITFHRAFDMCNNPFKAIDILKEYGIDRILSSGQKQNALQGALNLKDYQEYASGSITFIAGSGIKADNIQEIAKISNLHEFHFSGKCSVPSLMEFRQDSVSMSSPCVTIDEYLKDQSSFSYIKDTMASLIK